MSKAMARFAKGSSVIWLLGLMLAVQYVSAQSVSTLIQFTNVWKYDQSGLELGTAWRTNDFDDSAWSSGRGLLGIDDNNPAYAVHAPISTPLVASTTVTTYYFRTTFQFTGLTNGLVLMASNLVDDGAVIYLNGMPAARLRMPVNSTANTYATSGPTVEGSLETVGLTNLAYLRFGENLLAVEVHQASFGSADIMWGLKLVAIEPTPLVITNQPSDQSVLLGDSVTLGVGVSGGPVVYRWQKDDVNIPNATNATYSIANAQLATAGRYRVVVSNALGAVFSREANLNVFLDLVGPRLISAQYRDVSPSNRIIVTFSEVLNRSGESTNVANYRINRCGTDDTVLITNAVWGATQIQLQVSGPNWVIGDCYYLTVNNVTDARTNRISPNSQIPIAWPLNLNLLPSDASWDFHAAGFFEPEVYDEDWTATNYLGSFWWAQGNGAFYGGPPPAFVCLGAAPLTVAGFQSEPMLFRTTFQWPAGLGSTATLRPRFVVDDGLVLYLNGVEIFRYNMPSASGPIAINSLAASSVGNASCITNLATAVTNLMPGQNWLAAAVVQSTSGGNGDLLFGMSLTASTTTNAPLPATPVPRLEVGPMEGTNAVRLWWTGGGYALEGATNLTDNSASYPVGPWQEVPVMSNPYTNSLSNPTRFFRLKK